MRSSLLNLSALAAILGTASSLELPSPQARFTRGAAVRAGVFGAASFVLGGVRAEASWDPKIDFMVGAEKNAIDDYEYVQAQQVQPGKFDLNAALVTDYKVLPGMYPHAAGIIASNGPYKTVDDLFALRAATANDKALFKKYRDELTVLPPGRGFYERINARQST
ncbi:hypothetical protein AB1Y20_021895 [Prymnesium parvum]|uniref:Photosystem II 12 kDa extrinsic protein n=1 Tax=Prymnesium parvum TaxID=97485 RepID=A0AB34JH86_PRYPA